MMRKMLSYTALGCLLAFLLFVPTAPVFAQAKSPVNVRSISGDKPQTPQYQLLKGQVMARTLDWYRITVAYDTDPDWIDELTFTYYVLTKGKKGQLSLFKGDVTYVNVAKGKHLSDMYLHPSTLARYGSADRVAVLVSSKGRMLAMDSNPRSATRWWEQFPVPPVEGLVLNRMQTPFAMVNFDDYEAIKIPSR